MWHGVPLFLPQQCGLMEHSCIWYKIRHNAGVVRHTEGVALSPIHKGRCPIGQRGKHQDFVLLCYATSMTWRSTLRQPSAATSLSEGGLWCNIYLSGVRHRYDAVISRHNVVVVRHTEGVALSPLHKGRCPTGQRGKHQDFVLLCYATSMTCRATFPVGKVQYVESTEFSCRKSAGWRRVLPKKCRKF